MRTLYALSAFALASDRGARFDCASLGLTRYETDAYSFGMRGLSPFSIPLFLPSPNVTKGREVCRGYFPPRHGDHFQKNTATAIRAKTQLIANCLRAFAVYQFQMRLMAHSPFRAGLMPKTHRGSSFPAEPQLARDEPFILANGLTGNTRN